MSLDYDDPLAGILSDGSDDSFFDDDILGKKKSINKKTTTAEKKKSLFDLDGPQALKPVVTASNENTMITSKDNKNNSVSRNSSFKKDPITKPNKSPAPIKRSLSKESVIPSNTAKNFENINFSHSKDTAKSTEKLDILSDLLDDKKPLKTSEKGKSSQSLLSDILGGPSTKTLGTTQQKPGTAAKNQDNDFESLLGKSDSKQTFSSNSSKPIASLKPETKVEQPKKIQPKKSSDDWLGIFKSTDDAAYEEESDMPSWLSAGAKKTKTSEKIKPEVETVQESKEVEKVVVEKEENEITDKKIDELTKPALSSKLEISSNDIALEGATLCLQQQEAQLMVAMQLKAQDEKLAAMQMRQKDSQRLKRETAEAHQEQLDAMLRRQAEHRRQMQSIIASHQDRITQRIKALLADSNDADTIAHDGIETSGGGRDSPYLREKKQLLQLVQSLQENHDKEIDLMETSYRRQIDFLELSYTQAEERMKEESDKLVKFYTEKISWLDEHHRVYKTMAEENLKELTERHNAENEMMRQQHGDNVKVLQEHHAALMENIRNAVKQEQALMKDSAGFSSDLQDLIGDVKANNAKNEQLYEKVENFVQESQQNAVKSLLIREKHINDMLEQLKKDREDFERDKTDNKDIVKMLESRLRQMTTMMEEETASLRQKKMEFEFEKATFSKQTEFAKNVLKKQDEEIKMQKEELQKEYQEKLSRVEEDRSRAIKDSALVAKEKASIQNLKLEIEKTKAELDAHLQEIAEERTKLNAEKQELHIEEQRIMAKSRDLDLLAKTAMEKQSQGEKMLSEANFVRQKYEDRIRRIQEHVVSLNTREKQIAKEKVALSRERLSLHNERKELENKQCSLCRSNQTYIPEPFMPIPNRNFASGYRPRDQANFYSNTDDIEMEVSQLIGTSLLDERRDIEGVNVNPREDARIHNSGRFKDYMDPKFTMLRLDVQRVINNLERSKKDGEETENDNQ